MPHFYFRITGTVNLALRQVDPQEEQGPLFAAMSASIKAGHVGRLGGLQRVDQNAKAVLQELTTRYMAGEHLVHHVRRTLTMVKLACLHVSLAH